MGKTTAFRSALKYRFFRYAEMRGFLVSKDSHPLITTFTRRMNDAVHIFDIQWSKRGDPRFIVNFGKSILSNVTEEEKADACREAACHNADVWGRLYPRAGTDPESWFRCDLPFYKKLFCLRKYRRPDEVLDELMNLFPELEVWWNSEIAGPHMRVLRSRGKSIVTSHPSNE